MTVPKEDLIAKYLAGDANADEVQKLNQALADDAQAADDLMSEAYMEVYLRETPSGSVLGAAIAEKIQPLKPVAARLPPAWITAAMLLVAISGWAVAVYVAYELRKARSSLDTPNNRVTQLKDTSTRPPVDMANGDVPEIHSMRGLLMASRQPNDTDTEIQLLQVGTTAPLDQRLWTCPWGATEFRYDSGVSISVERNSAVKFNETNGQRMLTLERGIVHVTNLSKTDKRRTEIRCPRATVRLNRGQVAVQVDEQQTAVEAAIHQVKVLVKEEGATREFTVRRGQYLIIKSGEKTKVMQGMLKLGLEPPSR